MSTNRTKHERKKAAKAARLKRRQDVKAENGMDDPPDGLSYTERNRNLKKLGYTTYRGYLDSDFWKAIRDKVFQTKGRLCSICKRSARHVHHRDYCVETLRGEKTSALVPICTGCHRRVEYARAGQKRSVLEARRQYNLLWRRHRNKAGKKRAVERRAERYGGGDQWWECDRIIDYFKANGNTPATVTLISAKTGMPLDRCHEVLSRRYTQYFKATTAGRFVLWTAVFKKGEPS